MNIQRQYNTKIYIILSQLGDLYSIKTLQKDNWVMDTNANNFKYRRFQKTFMAKTQQQPESQCKTINYPQPKISHPSNVYTGKNYSSIKPLIKRIQTTGKSHIFNIPCVNRINQRNDIYLSGGAISYTKPDRPQNVNKIRNFNKKTAPNNKMQTVIDHLNVQTNADDLCICKHFPMQLPEFQSERKSFLKKVQMAKTEVQKSGTFGYMSKKQRIKFVCQSPATSQEIEQSKEINQEKVDENQKSLKFERTQACISFKQSVNFKEKQLHPTRLSTTGHQIRNIHQNKSQNTIPSSTVHSKRIKISKSIIKSKSQIQKSKNSNHKPQTVDKRKKPLFYILPDELKQMNISAKSFIVMQYPSGQLVTGVYYRQVNEIASLTKIVTFYCCLLLIQNYNLDMDKQILIIDQQAQETSGTSAQLREGDKYTFRQICYGMMLPSGNDAALAMSKWGGGVINANKQLQQKQKQKERQKQKQANLKTFMSYMNNTCQQIGMRSSYFGNPHGLPHTKSGSTAQDIAFLISEGLKNEFFCEVIKAKQYRCWIENDGKMREVVWENTHKLLRRDGFIGGKTGVTVTAGPCLSTCYQLPNSNRIFIIVLLKASKLSRRFKQTRKILAKCLSKLFPQQLKSQIKQIEKNDIQLDSDNSQDQAEFNYQKNDVYEMNRRAKILVNEM